MSNQTSLNHQDLLKVDFFNKLFENFSFGNNFNLQIFNVSLVFYLNSMVLNFCSEMVEKFSAYFIKFHFCRVGRE